MKPIHAALTALMFAATAWALLASSTAQADDSPGPCPALKRIVAAAPGGFGGLQTSDVQGIAQPAGDNVQCGAISGGYQCEWTPHGEGGEHAGALESVAADVASCLPDATHDENSPARQHFYLGPRDQRTEIAITMAGTNRIRLAVSRR